MMIRYPTWAGSYGPDAIDETGELTGKAAMYLHEISHLTPGDIDRAIALDARRGEQYPPSIPQLLTMAKPPTPETAQSQQPRLIHCSDNETVQRHIAEIREKLRGPVALYGQTDEEIEARRNQAARVVESAANREPPEYDERNPPMHTEPT